MLWYLGNAMGWIKVQVADDEVDIARALLSKHINPAASTLDEPVDDSPEAALSPSLTGSDEAEAGDEHEDENEEDEPEPSLTDREKDAERACRGACCRASIYSTSGLCLLPLAEGFRLSRAPGRPRAQKSLARSRYQFAGDDWDLLFLKSHVIVDLDRSKSQDLASSQIAECLVPSTR